MEGRFPPAIRCTFTRCADPAQEQAFNEWYDHVHLPDILGSGVAARGLRYRNSEPAEGAPDYLAVYELKSDDLAGVDEAYTALTARLREAGRMHPASEITRRAMWRRIGPEFTTPRSGREMPGGLFIIESNCTSPDRVDAFTTWYDGTHIPDLLGTGVFITAYRFEAMAGQPGGRYLAIYETDGDPLAAVTTFVREHRPRLKAAGRLGDLIEITYRGIFRGLRA